MLSKREASTTTSFSPSTTLLSLGSIVLLHLALIFSLNVVPLAHSQPHHDDRCYWDYCDQGGHYHFSIGDAYITPNPPIRGGLVYLFVNGTLDEQITGGTSAFFVEYGHFPIFNQTWYTCLEAHCPIPSGAYSFNHAGYIPDNALCGDYYSYIEIQDQNQQNVACVRIKCEVSCDTGSDSGYYEEGSN